MSDGIIALIVVGSVLVYAIGCGVLYGVGKHKGWDFEDPGPLLCAVLWPLALPATAAAMITMRLLTPRTKLPKAEVRRG